MSGTETKAEAATDNGGVVAGTHVVRISRAGIPAAVRTLCCAAALASSASRAVAQPRPVPADTVVSLDALVVTADRAQTPLAASAASVSRLSPVQLARIPQRTLADALAQLPGFTVVSFDGLGYDPQLMVRGFYGGGEAEYVLVMVDGRPVNNLQGGGIAWDALPLASAEAVEVVRGGASALYGDAALAGVINIITGAATDRESYDVPHAIPPPAPPLRASASTGTFGTWSAQLAAHPSVFGDRLHLSGGTEQTDGFRDHAGRTAWHAGGSLALVSTPEASATVSAHAHWREFEEPGPLLGGAMAENRAASDVFFRFDRTHDDAVRAAFDGALRWSDVARITGSLSGEQRSTDAVRTIALSPEFADTKERVLRTDRAMAMVHFALDDTPLPFADRLIAGVDASYGRLDSDYYTVLTGPRAVYQTASGTRGQLDTSGAGNRAAGAVFAHYALAPIAPVRLSVGARADWLRDSFDARTPDAERNRTTHEAFSPKAGINLQYLRRAMHRGHAYATVSRSFKAPTLDQLYDLRRIPVPVPPFAITTSNPELSPQRGTSVEAGLYHSVSLSPDVLAADLTLAAYDMRMKDELDFDVQTLRYVNIGRSRHRGLETGVRVAARSGAALLNYTWQRATAEAGPHAGKYLKAIPRHTLSGGVTLTPLERLEAGAFVQHNRDIFLDDANTTELSDYTRVDARLAYALRGVHVFFDVRNVFAAQYSTTGFVDPSGSGAIYYYPAAGRSLEIGIHYGRQAR